jgi:hypothetical protein
MWLVLANISPGVTSVCTFTLPLSFTMLVVALGNVCAFALLLIANKAMNASDGIKILVFIFLILNLIY